MTVAIEHPHALEVYYYTQFLLARTRKFHRPPGQALVSIQYLVLMKTQQARIGRLSLFHVLTWTIIKPRKLFSTARLRELGRCDIFVTHREKMAPCRATHYKSE
jgi:hypothetical protein